MAIIKVSMIASNSLIRNNMRNIILQICICLGLFSVTGCGDKNQKKSAIKTQQKQQNSIKFLDVTIQSGLGDFLHENGAFGEKWFPEPMGGGGGFIDYNNDGWQDILLVRGGTWPEKSNKIIPIN